MKLPINKIIHGDCLEVIQNFPDESVNCILTDPPYGIRKGKVSGDESLSTYYQSLPELYRILKTDSFFATCCSVARIPEMFKNNPFIYRWTAICYSKNNMIRGSVGFSKFTPILIFMKGKAKIKKQLRDVFEYTLRPLPLHPNEKSVEWFQKLICCFTKENDIILDPFVGSGTTCVGAKKSMRRWIGIDINAECVKIAKKRINNIPQKLSSFSAVK